MILNSGVIVPMKSRVILPPPPLKKKIHPPNNVNIISRIPQLQPFASAAVSSGKIHHTDTDTDTAALLDSDQLRTQLNRLYEEANFTRSKANNARSRLMRLSEAAENLQQRAATKVLVDKEVEARELLVEKKKLIQKLEKLKNRVEVLDELTMKINEAISLKEKQLIGCLGMYPDVKQADSSQIRFISPKDENGEISPKDENGENVEKTNVLEESQAQNHGIETQDWEADPSRDWKESISEKAASVDSSNDDGIFNTLEGISSYENFLEYVDGQLRRVEADLFTFVRISALIMESEQKQMTVKVQQTSAMLEDVRSIRGKIARIIKTKKMIPET